MARVHLTSDAEFKESDHPRKPAGSSEGGQFTEGGGGGGEPDEQEVLAGMYGFKKVKEDAGNLIFKLGDSQLVIDPLGHFYLTNTVSGKVDVSGGEAELEDKLSKWFDKVAVEKDKVTKDAEYWGFFKQGEDGTGVELYHHPAPTMEGVTLLVNNDGSWELEKFGEHVADSGASTLSSAVNSIIDKAMVSKAEVAGAAGTKAGQFIINSHLGQLLKKYGYKKGPDDAEGNLVFKNPDGNNVVIHPPKTPGAKSSSDWTHYNPKGESLKGVGLKLEKALAKYHGVQTLESQAGKSVGQLWNETAEGLKQLGFKQTSPTSWHNSAANISVSLYESGGWYVTGPGSAPINQLSGLSPLEAVKQKLGPADKSQIQKQWPDIDTDVLGKGFLTTSGTGGQHYTHPSGLKFELYSNGFWQMKKNGQSIATAGQAGEDPTISINTALELTQHFKADEGAAKVEKQLGAGWKKSENEASVTFTKGDALITYSKVDGKWTSISPGHLAKSGASPDDLVKLLQGKPGNYKNATTPPAAKAPAPPKPKPEHVEQYVKLQKAQVPPTAGQKAAVSDYKGSGYHQMNDCLRYQENCDDPDVHKVAAWLDDNKLPHDVTVWRGVKGEYAKILKSIITTGTKFQDKGFMSTTTSPQFGSNWAGGLLFKISAKAGQKAATIYKEGSHDHEYEVLFQRGSHLVVKGYDKATRTVDCELVQE